MFYRTAVALETESETWMLDLRRQTPHINSSDLCAPEVCQPYAVILSATVRHSNGEVVEKGFLKGRLVLGQVGDGAAQAAFALSGWVCREQAKLADLICEALWGVTLTIATYNNFEPYLNRIISEIGLLMDQKV